MFVTSPYGFVKGKNRGHHVAARTPQTSAINTVKQENSILKEQLDAQAALMAELTAKVEALAAAKKGKK